MTPIWLELLLGACATTIAVDSLARLRRRSVALKAQRVERALLSPRDSWRGYLRGVVKGIQGIGGKQ